MQVIDCPSPNFGPRKDGATAEFIILHYTGMETAQAALDRLCDPEPEVSSHYLICERGQIYRLVDEEMRAWHAGTSFWQGRTDLNSCSIGIELSNPGPLSDYPPFPHAQMDAVVALVADIRARRHIPTTAILGHSDVAPGRKVDPGPKFDWDRVVGAVTRPTTAPTDADLLAMGYDPQVSANQRSSAYCLRYRTI